MGAEHSEGLSPEQAESFKARANAHLLVEEGALTEENRKSDSITPEEVTAGMSRTVRANNLDAVRAVAADENRRYDALEGARNGDMGGFSEEDQYTKDLISDGFAFGGLETVNGLADVEQGVITEGPLDIDALGTKIAEKQLGTDARGTEKMEEATRVSIDSLNSKIQG